LIESQAQPQVTEKLEINFRRDERVIRFSTSIMDQYPAEHAAHTTSVISTKKAD